jgi:hypothetical protein
LTIKIVSDFKFWHIPISSCTHDFLQNIGRDSMHLCCREFQ